MLLPYLTRWNGPSIPDEETTYFPTETEGFGLEYVFTEQRNRSVFVASERLPETSYRVEPTRR